MRGFLMVNSCESGSDKRLDDWLRNKVAPTFDAMLADPSRGIPKETVFEEIRKRHSERMNIQPES